MKEGLKILTYCVAVVIGAGLLAPPLYWLGQWAIRTDLLPQLAPFPFGKYLNRAVLIIALALLWPMLRWLGVRRWTDLMLSPNPRRLSDLCSGFAIAAVGLFSIGALMLATDVVAFRGLRWDKIGGAVLTAAVVATIEEILFRGAFFGALRRSLSWQRALIFLSFLFAALHFIRPKRHGGTQLQEVTWWSGFQILPNSFWQFAEPQLLVGSFISLVLVGLVLGYAVVRTRSLYLAIGLHAGWVFGMKSFNAMTSRLQPPSLWLGRDVVSGLAPLLLLVATGVIVWWMLRHREEQA